jgi:hypothetical protein
VFEDANAEVAAVLAIGKRRCADMLRVWADQQWEHDSDPPTTGGRMGILDLLASAYLQGVQDAGRTIAKRGLELDDD